MDARRDAALARAAQKPWSARPVHERLAVVRRLRHGIARAARELAVSVSGERTRAEVLTSEVLPLADACRFLERQAPRLLATRRLGAEGRPAWLAGVEAATWKVDFGLVGGLTSEAMCPLVERMNRLSPPSSCVLR